MKRIATIALAAACLVACGGAPTTAEPDPGAMPELDAGTTPETGPTMPEAGPAPEAGIDAHPGAVQPEAGQPEAAPPLPEAAPPITPDAGELEAGKAPEAAVDARPSPMPDAGSRMPDAAPDTGTGPAPFCTSTAPACVAANRADGEIRATFPAACSTGARSCGSVLEDGTVVTYPLECKAGIWRLSGSFLYGTSWVPSFTCSKGCGAAGVMCPP